jgi:sulfur carrier protein ThiS adenylyltransferase
MDFNAEIFSANPDGVTDKLQGKRVFIAGAGGLGSNVALMLARAGVGTLSIADFDTVSVSNLNRQFFFTDQVREPKVTALADNLRRAVPTIKLGLHRDKLTPENMPFLIADNFDIICECFDNPICKAQLTEFALTQRSNTPLVTVSGLSGYGPVEDIKVQQRSANWYVIGDGTTEAETSGTIASRVTIAAAMQAHTVIRILLGV